jgi:hypothetical protein
MNMRVWALLVCAVLCIGATPRHSHHPARQPLTAEVIEQAQFGQGQKDNTALIVKAEVLLDRSGFSAGVIDGRDGDNYRKALAAFRRQPAPSGEFKVKGVAHNPTYHYDPRFAFKGVKAQHKFTIRPGPKNPVGIVWIDLSAPSYGIHGTPSPEKIGKTESHGCIRLTNWDAFDLAGMVHRGTVVDFVC